MYFIIDNDLLKKSKALKYIIIALLQPLQKSRAHIQYFGKNCAVGVFENVYSGASVLRLPYRRERLPYRPTAASCSGDALCTFLPKRCPVVWCSATRAKFNSFAFHFSAVGAQIKALSAECMHGTLTSCCSNWSDFRLVLERVARCGILLAQIYDIFEVLLHVLS